MERALGNVANPCLARNLSQSKKEKREEEKRENSLWPSPERLTRIEDKKANT